VEALSIISTFHFLRPWWLLCVPVWAFVAYIVWINRQQNSGWSALCDPALLNYLIGDVQQQRATAKGWGVTLTLAGVIAITALAGPVWKQLPQPVFQAQSAMIIVLDLSRSMDAEDVQPSRLIRAKQKVHDILAARIEGQTGLIVFAGSAFDVVPLTTDNQAILSLLSSLDTSMMPAQGSMASEGLKHAMAMFQRGAIQQGSVVMLCDGVDQAASSVARQLADAGHIVSILAIGTSDGAPIPARSDEAAGEPAGGFMKDERGNIVLPRMDAQRLSAVAVAGNGLFQLIRIDDADVQRLPGLIPFLFADMQDDARHIDSIKTDQWYEEGPWLALLLLPLCALAFRRGVLLLLVMTAVPLLSVMVFPAPSYALAWKDLWQTSDQQAQALMAQDKPKAAAVLFDDAQWKAAAHYRAKAFDAAVQTLDGMDDTESLYNKANALARSGDFEAALEAYDAALEQNPSHQDAIFNRDLIAQMQQEQNDEQRNNEGKNGQDEAGGEQSDQNNQDAGDSSSEQQGDQSEQTDTEQSEQEQVEKEQTEKEKSDAERSEAEQGKTEPSEAETSATDAAETNQSEQQETSQGKERDPESIEQQQALEQWLRRIPDDPGGLLRRKFKYQYQQQQGQAGSKQAW